MKTSLQTFGKKSIKTLFLMMAFFSGIMAMAQEATTTTQTTTKTEEWYANPLYIVLGALAAIILIALLVRGNRK